MPTPTSLIAIVGATGTGKSEFALDLAESLAATGRAVEVVNADAMQLYRGMDIGTAKLAPEQRRGVTHHLLDVLAPSEESSAASYQQLARNAVLEIQSRQAIPLLVGGSGLYVSSVLEDLKFPARDPAIRTALEIEGETVGATALYQRLLRIAPEAAAAIDPANLRRVIRALEAIQTSGKFTPGQPQGLSPWQPAIVIGLSTPREQLVTLLDRRVEAMWAAGLVAEVSQLRGAGFGPTAARAIGYAQAIAQLDGMMTQDTAIAAAQALTRRYARRQVSWFRRNPRTVWLASDDPGRIQSAMKLVTA